MKDSFVNSNTNSNVILAMSVKMVHMFFKNSYQKNTLFTNVYQNNTFFINSYKKVYIFIKRIHFYQFPYKEYVYKKEVEKYRPAFNVRESLRCFLDTWLNTCREGVALWLPVMSYFPCPLIVLSNYVGVLLVVF